MTYNEDHVLWIDEGEGEKTTWPNPMRKATLDAAWCARYAPEKLTPHDAMELAEVYEAYKQLLVHCWGTERSIAKLRKLRREVLGRFPCKLTEEE